MSLRLRILSLWGVLFFAAIAAFPTTTCGETIWIEGEKPARHKMNRHPWWYDQVKREHLSAGDWISNFSDKKEGFVWYEFSIKEGGTYVIWLRANPVKSTLEYKLDEQPWKQANFENAFDVVNIAADGKPDLRFIGWVRLGRFQLSAGNHTLAFHTKSKLQNHGAIDCFVVTNEKFVPRGLARPGAPETVAEVVTEDGTWAFAPQSDPLSEKSWIDLRYLNEPMAGQSGFIRLSADGMSFIRGDGEPIRFWAVVDYGWRLEPEQMRRHVRWLAKLGVNMVRIHAQICNSKPGAKITDVNEKEIDQIFRYVAEVRKHGIYVTLSPFWAHIDKIPESWQLEGYTGQSGPTGLLFFVPKMQEAYKAWVRELYTRVNPYTGIPLRDDPTIAVIQVQNEDSLLFWTSQGIREPHAGRLRRLFAEWLVRKYGSLEAAYKAWGNVRLKNDKPEAGEMGLYIIWHFTSQAPKANEKQRKRMADQLAFMAELQYDFYKDIADYYRNTLGCKQLINATNWKSADPVLLEDVERWTYTATDVSAVNRYTGGIHIGPNNGWRIEPGHKFRSDSVLRYPETFPGALKQTVGQPMLITESSWVPPTLYRSEGPMLAAAYLSLTGVDALYWFAFGEETWMTDPVFPWWKIGGLNVLKKWYASGPMYAGMFPAAALAFRKGYIKAAPEPAVYEERSLDDLWYQRVPIIAEAGKYDPNRDPGSFAPESPIKQEVDRLAFFVGPVYVRFGGKSARSRVVDLSKYIDHKEGLVRSMTGELTLDFKHGVLVVDAPKAQGVCGFLKDAGGRFELSDVVIESENQYAAVLIVPLDDQPLRDSKRLLVQVGTTARLTGWTDRAVQFKADGKQIEGREIIDTGRPPFRIANNHIRLLVHNGRLRYSTKLDPNGVPVETSPTSLTSNGISVELPPDCLYVVLHSEN